jgi:hypothetical protein
MTMYLYANARHYDTVNKKKFRNETRRLTKSPGLISSNGTVVSKSTPPKVKRNHRIPKCQQCLFRYLQWQHAYYLKQRVSKRERITCSKLRAKMIAQNVNSNSCVSIALEIARQPLLPQQNNSSCSVYTSSTAHENPLEQATRFLSLLTPSGKILRNGRKPGLRSE